MKKSNPELKKLRAMRKEKGLKASEISDYLNMSASMYGQIERGDKRLSYEIAVKIAELYGVSPDEIFYEDFENYLE